MLYDTILLRTFVAICETKSFTKAARSVNLTQPAVSLHVKRLEEQVGRRLFARNIHPLALTEGGEILLSYAQRILALHEEAETRLVRNQPRGLIRLGAPEYFDPQTLAMLLAQFAARYPAVRLQIEMGIGPDIAMQFDRGKLDLAIVNREIGEGDGIVLCRERRVWAAARGMKLDPEAPLPLALFPPHCGWRRFALARLEEAGLSWTLVLQSSGVAGILAAVETGLAISILAQNNLSSTLKELGEAEGLPELPDFEYVLRRNERAAPAADSLAEVIADFFRGAPATARDAQRGARRIASRDPSRLACRAASA